VPGEFWWRDFIYDLALEIGRVCYLELGLRECETFNRVAPICDLAVGVDSNRSCLDFHGGEGRVYCVPTSLFFENASERDFNLVFIDADHSKEAVQRDFEGVFPLVVDQGLILIHDTYPVRRRQLKRMYCHDAYRAVKGLKNKYAGQCEMMTLPLEPGLTICRKTQEQCKFGS
jgi:hypothetical protein